VAGNNPAMQAAAKKMRVFIVVETSSRGSVFLQEQVSANKRQTIERLGS